ncbi:hypothetical protein HDU98_000435 [Podochytrium sp. JEL0797]|nr:hypothetical protein HDU98_000435 [Podochytrium sp. JEL0797]
MSKISAWANASISVEAHNAHFSLRGIDAPLSVSINHNVPEHVGVGQLPSSLTSLSISLSNGLATVVASPSVLSSSPAERRIDVCSFLKSQLRWELPHCERMSTLWMHDGLNASWTVASFAGPTGLPECRGADGSPLLFDYSEATFRWFRQNESTTIETSTTGWVSVAALECDFAPDIAVEVSHRVGSGSEGVRLVRDEYSVSNNKLVRGNQIAVPATTNIPIIPHLSIETRLSPKEGFHPSLHVSFAPPASSTVAHVDSLIIHLPIDHNAFIDPFQLQGLSKLDDNIAWFPFGEPDLEVAASDAQKALMNGVFVVVKNVDLFFKNG